MAAGGPDGAGTGGSAGVDRPSSCVDERAALVQLLKAATACVRDADCMPYQAPCLQTESGNCGGIFYVTAASAKTIDDRKRDFEACSGSACGAGGVCGLGPTPPVCVAGQCR
ncbi:MAG TPA: hypothetical protein VGJ91_22855 [Polyangiaceae bacterium]